jgi:hypothetical protein
MSLSKPLRDESFRYRKRKQISLDGSVPGIDSSRPRGDYVSADLGPWGLPPREYVGPLPQEYEPHPGFAQFPETDYETYAPQMPRHLTPMLRDPGPEPVPPEPMPRYNDCLMTDELFAEAMADAGVQLPPAEPAEADSLENLLASPAMIDDRKSLEMRVVNMIDPDTILEIESVIDQQMQLTDAFEPAQPEPVQPDLFEEQQQLYDEQMQQLMDPFGMMGPGPMV